MAAEAEIVELEQTRPLERWHDRHTRLWHYEKLLGAVVAAAAVVTYAGVVARGVVDHGANSFSGTIDKAKTVIIDPTQGNVNDVKKRIDVATKECQVIQELKPQIDIIASAVGTTTTSTLPPTTTTTQP